MPRTIGELAVKVLDDVIAHYRRRRCSDKRHPAQQRSTLRTLLRPAAMASAATGPRMCVLVAGRHRDSRAVTICLRAAYAVTLRASCPFPARRLLLFPNSVGCGGGILTKRNWRKLFHWQLGRAECHQA